MAAQTAAQRAAAAASEELKEITTPPTKPAETISAATLVKVYNIVVDCITGQGHHEEAPGILKGKVTRADIEAAGADFEWLLKSGSIEEAGYVPVN